MGKRKNRNRQARQEGSAMAIQSKAGLLPTQEFLSKHEIEKVELEKNVYANRVRRQRPIDISHKMYCDDRDKGIGEHYRRGINDDQFRAADRLANNYKRRLPNVTMPLDAIRVDTSLNISMYPIESIIDAVNQHARLMRQLSPMSQDIVEEICCKETNLRKYEMRKQGWRKGYAITRLREALNELIEAYKCLRKV